MWVTAHLRLSQTFKFWTCASGVTLALPNWGFQAAPFDQLKSGTFLGLFNHFGFLLRARHVLWGKLQIKLLEPLEQGRRKSP